jgi:hypothetical protein
MNRREFEQLLEEYRLLLEEKYSLIERLADGEFTQHEYNMERATLLAALERLKLEIEDGWNGRAE